MALTDTDLALIRDEVGSTPADDTLVEWGDELGHWMPVAIRALKRRRADAAAGGQDTTSFTLTGVLSVGMAKADLTALDRRIADLEARWAALNGEPTGGLTVGRLTRPDRHR